MVTAYATMLPNIAPAPGPPQGQQQMAAQAPMAGQPITAQMGPALQQQQFFLNPQAMPAGATAAAPIPMTQFATYNQQGQLVIQQMPLQIPANQQPGQQQILYTNAAAVAAQQQAAQQQQQHKPGQPMMAAGPPGSAVAGKPMAMPGTAVSQNYAIAGSGTLVASTAGGQQTLMIANPMSAVTSQPGTPVSGSQQVKQIQPSTPDGKGAPANMSSATTPTQMLQVPTGAPGTPQTPQMFVNAQGMVMASMPGNLTQAFVQGNQLFLRAPAPQDASAAQPVMFSSPTAPNQSPLAPQQPGQLQPQANPQLAAQPLQPMAMARAPMSTFQPVNQPVKQGKTAISRAMPIRHGFQSPQVPPHIQPQPPQLPHTSPKGSKSKSPRVPGLIGRPPGPGKAAAALNALKGPAAVAPQRLPSSVVSSMAVVAGPPMLQTTQALLPPPVVVQAPQTQFPGMPKLQPMAMAAPPAPAVLPPPPAVEPKKEEAPGAASAADSKDEVESKESVDTPKAVVKPNVLSHVIDGHVIKESSTPFPVRDDKEGNDRERTNASAFEFLLFRKRDATWPPWPLRPALSCTTLLSSASCSSCSSFRPSLLLIWLLLLPCRIGGGRCVKAAMQCGTAIAWPWRTRAAEARVVGHYSVILYEQDKYTARTHSVRGRERGRERKGGRSHLKHGG